MATSPKLVTVPRLQEIIADPARMSALPKEAIPALRGELARLDTMLLCRLFSPAQIEASSESDRLLTVTEAAARLGLSKDSLYRNEYPFVVKIGSRRRFSEKGIEKFIRNRAGM